MRCSRWQRWIALDVGGDLDHRRRLKLGRHLEQCASCRDLESELRQGRESLQGLDLRADANLSLGSIHGQVMQAIADRPRIAGFGIPRFALIAAAAAAVVILAVFLRQGPVERGPHESRYTVSTPTEISAPVPVRAPPVENAVEYSSEPESMATEPVVVARKHLASTGPSVELRLPVSAEPMTIKILTEDPEVVIYWIVDPKGDNENA